MIDYQCARCGAELDFIDCDSCGGDGWVDAYDDDPINNSPGDLEPCLSCSAQGGWQVCGNSPEWCAAHPIEGREAVRRGEIERFEVGGAHP